MSGGSAAAVAVAATVVTGRAATDAVRPVRARRAVPRATSLLSCKLGPVAGSVIHCFVLLTSAATTAAVDSVVAVAAVVMPLPRKCGRRIISLSWVASDGITAWHDMYSTPRSNTVDQQCPYSPGP